MQKAFRYVHFFRPQKSYPFFYSVIRIIAIPSTHLTTTTKGVSGATIFNHTLLVHGTVTLLTPARIENLVYDSKHTTIAIREWKGLKHIILGLRTLVKNRLFEHGLCISRLILHNYTIQPGVYWLPNGQDQLVLS